MHVRTNEKGGESMAQQVKVKAKVKVPTTTVVLLILGGTALAAAALGINFRRTGRLAVTNRSTAQVAGTQPSATTAPTANQPATQGAGTAVGGQAIGAPAGGATVGGQAIGVIVPNANVRATRLDYNSSTKEMFITLVNDGPNRASDVTVSLYRTFPQTSAQLIGTKTAFPSPGFLGTGAAGFSNVAELGPGERFCVLVNLTPGTGFTENSYCDNVLLGAETIE